MKKIHYLSLVAITLFLNACTSIGPQTIPRDRFDYNTAISDSWKDQTLLNIVKIRYADMPLFVEVASIVSGYTLESSVNLSGVHVGSGNSVAGNELFSLGTSGKFSDRPTITYMPITGQNFNKSFMTPIPPQAILFLMQSGWSADLIFPLTVNSINGLKSKMAAGVNQREGDDDFYRVITLLRKIQKSGAVGMRLLKKGKGQESTVLFFHDKNISDELKMKLKELNTLLGLEIGTRSIKVTYGTVSQGKQEIAMLTQSLLQIMITMATQVDVPEQHVKEGRTVPSRNMIDKNGIDRKLINIKHSTEKPENAFTAVKYRDTWFWIDDRDFKSKRTFAFLMIIFSLTETGGKEGLPLVTIPAG
ncbi:MAG: hypothetical protein DRQ43_03670 [Gammaproteobacteria bacterium]|nr:MAG: hypothetical protein DRQ43_03670 [Gammaproteobacteria bacterium]